MTFQKSTFQSSEGAEVRRRRVELSRRSGDEVSHRAANRRQVQAGDEMPPGAERVLPQGGLQGSGGHRGERTRQQQQRQQQQQQ